MELTNEDRVALAAVVPWSPTALTEVTAAVEQIVARHVAEARAAALNEAADVLDRRASGGTALNHAAHIVRNLANSPPP